MDWDWDFVRQIMPVLLQGVKITILATVLGSILAAIVGLGIALARRSSTTLKSESPLQYSSQSIISCGVPVPTLPQM